MHNVRKMNKNGSVTLKNIAEACDVQVATVSRVLNNKSKFSIRPEKRAEILKTAIDMQYTPNTAAKNLRLKKTNQIMIYGFNINFTLEATNTDILDACISKLNAAGYQVNMIFPSNQNQVLAPLSSDGALIIGQLDHQLLESFEQFNIPFIILNDRIDNYSWVSVDDYYSMSLALNHLYELGHRRIAYRCAPQQHQLLLKHSSINDRYNAYCNWTKERNLLNFSDFGQNMNEDKFYKEMLKHKVTAVVTYGYLLAIALNEHCRKCNVNVPDDISIVAFNRLNEKFKGYNFTSIYMELEDMGNAAVDILLKKINGSLLNEQRVFKTYLHEGESSGPCCRKT